MVDNQALTDTFGLDGRSAVVTGAGSGIGKAIAHLLAKAGAQVLVADIDGEAGTAVAKELNDAGFNSVAVTADIADATSVRNMFTACIDAFGKVDILVNNASIFPKVPFLEVSEPQWERMHSVNLHGTFLCMQQAIGHMIESDNGGAIVNISSVSSQQVAVFNNVTYNTTKAGVNALTKTAALEFAKHNIRVNAVLPGGVATEGAKKASATASAPITGPLTQPERLPLGRIGSAEDIAKATLFLASPAAEYITGQLLAVDGGFQVS